MSPLDHLATTVPALPERIALLEAWATALAADADGLASAITHATGKPIRLSRSEVSRAVATVRSTAAAAPVLDCRLVELPGSCAEVHQVPVGPALAVTPFNFPLNLAVHKLAPAILAGCPVVWKPSPKAPGVAERALAAWTAAGGPAGLVTVAHASDAEVAAMLRDPRLRLLSFTGSAAVGARLHALAASARVRTVLELGGNAAVILHRTNHLPAVAAAVAEGACAHAGQACISVQRIFAPGRRADWTDALVAAFRAVPSGDPQDERTLCGPVIDDAAAARIQGLLDRLRAAGGRFLTGGTWQGRVLAPTLIAGVPANHPDVREQEFFAPIATLHPYADPDEALYAAEDTPFGLNAGMFTDDEALVQRAFRWLDVGTLVINDVPTRRDDGLPYGGMKGSGHGREGGASGVREYVAEKVLWRC